MADLTTTAAVKSYAGVTASTDDTEIGTLISAVSGLIHRIVGHDFEATSVTAEKHWTPTSGAVVLRKPAASLSAVRENGTTLDSSGYELTAERLVYRLSNGETVHWATSPRRIEVDYTALSTVPAALELAAREVCAFMVKQTGWAGGAGRMGLGAQANADTGTADYFVQALNKLPAASMVLRSYRAIV